jgi:hypothetical protein
MPHPLETWEQRRSRPVRFNYPEGAGRSYKLVDEVAVEASYKDIGDYVFLLQFLRGGGSVKEIRAAYYRKGPGKTRWHFAGQYSLTAERKDWIRLLAKALKTDWFQSVIQEAQALAEKSG